MAVASPVLLPWAAARNRRFQDGRRRAAGENRAHIDQAEPLEIPKVEFLELTVLVDWKTEPGFSGDAGVSYLLRTDLGALLFDVGFGKTRPALTENAAKLGFTLEQAKALAVSHLHLDHMGGLPAQRSRTVMIPEELRPSKEVTCFLPDGARAEGLTAEVVKEPRLLDAGIASTGPLARSLFLFGYTREQVLLACVKDKGLVVVTGCGHPGVDLILEMAGRLCREPLYALVGGLHLPVTAGRGNRAGIHLQTIFGTGKPPWQRITDDDLERTIDTINAAGPRLVLLSGHDTCDHALARMHDELEAKVDVLRAGATYLL